ncbi:MAG: hypothetical protein AAF497_14765 [Planctomycetota bacterium]
MAEIMVSCVLIVAAVGFMAPMTVKLARQRLVHREIFVGQHELANQMQRIMATQPNRLQELKLEVSPEHRAFLREADISLHLVPDEQTTRARIELTWESRAGFRVAPLRLTNWIPYTLPAEGQQ